VGHLLYNNNSDLLVPGESTGIHLFPILKIFIMKKFVQKLLAFCLPLILFLLSLAFLDPFNFVSDEPDLNRSKLKRKIATNINSRLYKLIEFQRSPTEIVILGDSRSDQLKSTYFESLLHKKTTNMSYGGGSLPEIISTFEEIVKSGKIKQVFIGIGFNLYNQKNDLNLVPEAIELKQSFISFLISKYCLKASLLYGKALLLNEDPELGKPPYTEKEFWDYQLYSSASNFYQAYSYPANYYKDLKMISNYCTNHNLKLVLLVLPTHVDLQKRIADFNLTEPEKQFRIDLSTLGDVYDFDYPNKLTVKRSNFLDPFHSTDSVSKLVVREIVTGNIKYARFTVQNKKMAFSK
jgi:hypothetical protein